MVRSTMGRCFLWSARIWVSVFQRARCARWIWSWTLTVTERPAAAVVQRSRKEQAAHAVPNLAVRVLAVKDAVFPAGQVTTRAWWSTVKSSTPNPPGMFGVHGHGLITGS